MFSFVCSGQIEIKHKFAFRLSKEIPDTSDEAHSPSLDIKNSTSMFTFQEETNSELKVRLCIHNGSKPE